MALLAQTNGVNNYLAAAQDEEPPSPKKKKTKYLAPEYILVFDDIAEELRSAVYQELLKRSRHFWIKTITASQALTDLKPSSRAQIRLWLIFGGQSPAKLEEVYRALDPAISQELFMTMYKKATTATKDNPKPFFYASRTGVYRSGFDNEFIIPQEVL